MRFDVDDHADHKNSAMVVNIGFLFACLLSNHASFSWLYFWVISNGAGKTNIYFFISSNALRNLPSNNIAYGRGEANERCLVLV